MPSKFPKRHFYRFSEIRVKIVALTPCGKPNKDGERSVLNRGRVVSADASGGYAREFDSSLLDKRFADFCFRPSFIEQCRNFILTIVSALEGLLATFDSF